jgi:hypothetical protein
VRRTETSGQARSDRGWRDRSWCKGSPRGRRNLLCTRAFDCPFVILVLPSASPGSLLRPVAVRNPNRADETNNRRTDRIGILPPLSVAIILFPDTEKPWGGVEPWEPRPARWSPVVVRKIVSYGPSSAVRLFRYAIHYHASKRRSQHVGRFRVRPAARQTRKPQTECARRRRHDNRPVVQNRLFVPRSPSESARVVRIWTTPKCRLRYAASVCDVDGAREGKEKKEENVFIIQNKNLLLRTRRDIIVHDDVYTAYAVYQLRWWCRNGHNSKCRSAVRMRRRVGVHGTRMQPGNGLLAGFSPYERFILMRFRPSQLSSPGEGKCPRTFIPKRIRTANARGARDGRGDEV